MGVRVSSRGSSTTEASRSGRGQGAGGQRAGRSKELRHDRCQQPDQGGSCTLAVGKFRPLACFYK